MKQYPLVSIITVNYNGTKQTCELLHSLRQITYPEYEVIVVDNGSTEDISRISICYPEVKLIRLPENLGFAGGNNAGIRHANGKYLMFLNNDTEVEPGFLEPLVETLEIYKDTAIVCPKIRFYSKPGIIQYAGSTAINPWRMTSRCVGFGNEDMGQYDHACVTGWAHGAAMLVRRDAIEGVGLMAEPFFLYYEELEWSIRFQKAGFHIRYVPDAVVYHKESLSTGKGSPLQAYFKTRNRLLLLRLHYSGLSLLAGMLYLLCLAYPAHAIAYLLRRQWHHFKAIVKAVMWHFSNPRIQIDFPILPLREITDNHFAEVA